MSGCVKAQLQFQIQHSHNLACAAIIALRCFVKCHHGQGVLPCACEMTDMNTSITHGSCKPPVSRPSLRHSTNASLGCNRASCATRCMPSNFKSPSVAGPTFAMSASLRGGVIEAELAITRARGGVIDAGLADTRAYRGMIEAALADTRVRRGVAETCLDFFVPATPQA